MAQAPGGSPPWLVVSPETDFPKLRPASNSMMADTYSHGFVAGGEDRHTIQSQRHRCVSTRGLRHLPMKEEIKMPLCLPLVPYSFLVSAIVVDVLIDLLLSYKIKEIRSRGTLICQ